MINKAWTLFLDRDGVINKRILGGYVQNWEQFEFLPGVTDAMKLLSPEFSRILVVSNQQGIGKGLMTETELDTLHKKMIAEVDRYGGRIDRIYYSPHLEKEGSVLRKPNVGMALLAKKEFPGIEFKRSVMVGDSISDMVFGRRLKMKTFFISKDLNLVRKNFYCIDFVFPDLFSFAEAVSKMIKNSN